MILAIPTRGMRKSIDSHNSRNEAVCDWIEASVLFSLSGEVSISDILDALLDEGIYEDQSFAREYIEGCLIELNKRIVWLGKATPLRVSHQKIIRTTKSWKDSPGYAYCLALSLASWYPDWAALVKDYTRQGLLFENLTLECLETLFHGWRVLATGWASGRARKIHKVVKDVASAVGESVGDVELYIEGSANEAGLDLVCYRPFPDGRVGIPVYLVQCASGKNNFKAKMQTPNMKVWTKIVAFTYTPKRAFATPFAFMDTKYRMMCNMADGLLLDRCRLLSAGHTNANWLSLKLSTDINKWLSTRIASLPSGD